MIIINLEMRSMSAISSMSAEEYLALKGLSCNKIVIKVGGANSVALVNKAIMLRELKNFLGCK